ncbi:LCP family protein [Terrisporobacter mayombei]|uniref:Cell envelope-related transcriptional attenuator domain-containing protein n=1 Tax=Terrisporobacter mayombei TaxID=1541 RepID=A0ABY9QAA9_9FIRM|nr:LCP family protein [Terrisporobacter mayombei]MCC3869634.1 LCP family protein [Terrisporobacter mayombei]WMT83427.1 hypothetical protein TEMA_39430 [Terrisporobacter mayombei]
MFKVFKKLKFIIISTSLIFIIIGIVTYADLFTQKKSNILPSSTKVKETITDNNTYTEGSTKDKASQNTTNILLLDDKSDSMVVASLDPTNKDIKLTEVANTGYFDRSNMNNLLNTVEKNLNINLDKFLKVDTSQLMNVISILGDISVNIKPEDIKLINNLIPKFYSQLQGKNKVDMKLITSPGIQNINEYQSLAYISVISKDSSKQQDTILTLVKNVKNLGFNKYFEIYNKMKPYVETNLTIPDMLKLASTKYEFR